MSAKARVLQADVTRVVRGMLAAGVPVAGVRVAPDGEIMVFSDLLADSMKVVQTVNPLDKVLLNAPQRKATQ